LRPRSRSSCRPPSMRLVPAARPQQPPNVDGPAVPAPRRRPPSSAGCAASATSCWPRLLQVRQRCLEREAGLPSRRTDHLPAGDGGLLLLLHAGEHHLSVSFVVFYENNKIVRIHHL
jgi:hypothetical protein